MFLDIKDSNVSYSTIEDEVYISRIKVVSKEYRITIGGINITVNKEWIKYFAIYNLSFPLEYNYCIKQLIFKPARFKNKKESKLSKFPFFKKPIEITYKDKVYRLLARYPYYAVSNEGEVINIVTKVVYTQYYPKQFGYMTVFIPDPLLNCKSNVSVTAHKLVALAWVDNDDYIVKNVVDHIDNNKLNNNANNLQWLSESGNQVKNPNHVTKVETRNIDTGEIKSYNSIREFYRLCNTKLNFGNKGNLLIPGKIWNIHNRRYEIRMPLLGQKWFYEDVKEIIDHTEIYGSNVQAKNLDTKEIVTGTVINVSKQTGVSTPVIYKKLKTKDDYTPVLGWLIRIKTNNAWADETNSLSFTKNEPVKVISIVDGIKTIHNSKREAARYYNICDRTVTNRLVKKDVFRLNSKCIIFKILKK